MIDPKEEAKWLDGLREFDGQNTNAIMAVFSVFGIPKSMIDFGCGSGVMVNFARAIGVEAFGVDQLSLRGDYFFQHDLTQVPDFLPDPVDLVLSIETAEHLPEEAADTFCDTLATRVSERGILVFTAAMPGQKGHGHLNCQHGDWWRRKFYDRGLEWDQEKTWRLALAWRVTWMSMHHLEANLQVFRRR
jgi:cyclopropane fatty-acyl-phospholipid synthase-like methyltransferase